LEGSGESSEIRRDEAALAAWRNACVFARFRLPARLHIACLCEEEGERGAIVIKRPPKTLWLPDTIDPVRLAGFVRLFHAFGFRFRLCEPGTIVEQPVELGPFRFRCGGGYVLDDAAAVGFAPEEDTAGSTEKVAVWVSRIDDDETAAEFRDRAGRPLRIRL